MASPVSENTRLSRLFTDPYLRARFAAAERDAPPAALAVEIEPVAPLAPGAVVRHLEA